MYSLFTISLNLMNFDVIVGWFDGQITNGDQNHK